MTATQRPDAPPIDALLASIPGLPRSILSRLVTRMIDQMDRIDGDPDMEDSEASNWLVDDRGRWIGQGPPPFGPWYEDDEDGDVDCCSAGDDRVIGGAGPLTGGGDLTLPGSSEDDEDDDFKGRTPHRRRIQRTRCEAHWSRPAWRGDTP